LWFDHAGNHLPRLDVKRKEDGKKSAPAFYSCVFTSCPPPFSHHTAVIIDWGFYTSVAPVFDWHSHGGCDHGDLWPRCCDFSWRTWGWNHL